MRVYVCACMRVYMANSHQDTRPRPEHRTRPEHTTTGTQDTRGTHDRKKRGTPANTKIKLTIVGRSTAKNEKKLKKVCRYGKKYYLCNRNQITNKYNNKNKATL